MIIGRDTVYHAMSPSDTLGKSYYIFDRYNKHGNPEFKVGNVSLAGTQDKDVDWEQTKGKVVFSTLHDKNKKGLD